MLSISSKRLKNTVKLTDQLTEFLDDQVRNGIDVIDDEVDLNITDISDQEYLASRWEFFFR
jgi:hypothetical protein